MKKTTIIFAASILLASAALFTGCQEAVFAGIMKDVSEEESTMNGNIISIARYQVDGQEFLVSSANTGLRYKRADGTSHGQWKTYQSLPFKLHSYSYYGSSNHEGERILKVLADSEYLYLVTVKETKNTSLGTSIPDSYSIYSKKLSLASGSNNTWSSDGEWTKVTETAKREDGTELLQFYTYDDYYYTRFNVFSTNSVKNEHRRVFIRSGKGEDSDSDLVSKYNYYELNGNSITNAEITNSEMITKLGYVDGRTVIDNALVTDLNYLSIDSAAYLGNIIYFFYAIAVTSNETKDEDATAIFYGRCDESKELKHNRKTNTAELYYFDGQNQPRKILDAGEPISCFALCNDALIIGRADYSYLTTYSSTGGVVKIELENRKPLASVLEDTSKMASKVAFSTNADSQLSSSYEIFTLLNVDPSNDEEDSSIYATIGYMGTGSSSSVSPKNVGMWSYYANRGNWNRE